MPTSTYYSEISYDAWQLPAERQAALNSYLSVDPVGLSPVDLVNNLSYFARRYPLNQLFYICIHVLRISGWGNKTEQVG